MFWVIGAMLLAQMTSLIVGGWHIGKGVARHERDPIITGAVLIVLGYVIMFARWQVEGAML